MVLLLDKLAGPRIYNEDRSTLLGSFLNIFLPPVCPLCEGGLSERRFCGACSSGIEAGRINSPICLVCGTNFTSVSGPDRTCGKCMSRRPPFKFARSAFLYDGAVLKAVHRFKYGGVVTLAEPLGSLMAEYSAGVGITPDVIVPVPLHKKRLRMRGFNQSLLLARGIRRRLQADLDYLSLIRVVPTKPQAGLKVDDRRVNVSGAFRLVNSAAFKGKKVLLVDDVFTTGATAVECSKTIKKAGAEVFVLTLARAAKS